MLRLVAGLGAGMEAQQPIEAAEGIGLQRSDGGHGYSPTGVPAPADTLGQNRYATVNMVRRTSRMAAAGRMTDAARAAVGPAGRVDRAAGCHAAPAPRGPVASQP
ncbi:hypothetical protein Maq22A_c19855 [Methylobacterium aquaticum]|uniref:Uncharacterized protein n=1 Tax=Methylobacterium aquaticum TaxID=270351 RepID=A0A0C6FIY0_9HYPH|nr:hypothetical protein Maq22A_c19855 [Methylobacterium aquaticum]